MDARTATALHSMWTSYVGLVNAWVQYPGYLSYRMRKGFERGSRA